MSLRRGASNNMVRWACEPSITMGPKGSEMEFESIVGYVAAVLTTLSFVPQAWFTFRTRNVSGISLAMYSLFTLGVATWLLYGALRQDWPIVIANGITLALASVVLTLTWRHRHRR
jgi:MtN3 and saliva related transmembrane protein